MNMKADGHLKKAEEIRASIDELLKDGERHVTSIVELGYGMVHHLVAYGLDTKHGKHRDAHHGIPATLRERGEDEMATLFERLDTLRHGRWYGGKGDGEIVEETMKIVDRIEGWCKE